MKKTVVTGLLIAIGVAGLLAPFASTLPDGLEKVTEGLGVTPGGAALQLPFSFSYGWWSGILGTLAVFAAVILLGRLFKKKQ